MDESSLGRLLIQHPSCNRLLVEVPLFAQWASSNLAKGGEHMAHLKSIDAGPGSLHLVSAPLGLMEAFINWLAESQSGAGS